MANFDIIVSAVDKTRSAFSSVESNLAKIERRAATVNKAVESVSKVANVAAVALGALAIKAVSYAGAINDASENTGVAVQSILALGNALTTNGGEAGKAADAINKFTDAVGTANAGSKQLRESFGSIGVTLQDLRTLDDTALFEKTLKGLAGVEDATRRNALQADIFGKTLKGANIAGFGKDITALSQAQRENAEAIQAAGRASDSLKNAFNTISVAAVKALQPISDTINNLGQDRINKIADSFLKIAAALTALAGAAKVFSVLSSVAAVFGAAYLTATVGVAKLALAFASFGKTLVIATGYVERFSRGVGATTTVTGLLAKLFARLPFVIAAIGTALAGIIRFIPFVGLIVTALYAVNEAVKFAFNIDPLEFFIQKAKSAYNIVKDFLGFGKEEFKVTVGTPTGAGSRADLVNKPSGPQAPAADRVQKDITLLGQLRESYATVRAEYQELKKALANTTDVNFASKLFEELSSRAEQLGIVLPKPAEILERDFSLSVRKTSEELRIAGAELQLTSLQAAKFANEVTASNNELAEATLRYADAVTTLKLLNNELAMEALNLAKQNTLLTDSGLLAKKFANEISAADNALTENAARLASSSTQQALFKINLENSRIGVDQQRITLELLNTAFANGKVTLTEYTDGLGSINERLLGITERTALLNEEYSTNSRNIELNTQLLASLTAQYEAGTIGLEEYTRRLSMLSYEYENLTSVTAKALKGARDEVRTQDLSTQATRDLTRQLRTGALSWREYEAAISKLDSSGVAKSFINITREIERAKSVAEVFAETLDSSVRKAGDTLASSLTEGIMKGKVSLRSFKDFFGSILNDISAMIIQKQFVSPIVDALTGAMGGGGSGGNLLSSIVGSVGKSAMGGGGFGDLFGGIGDFFGSIWPFAEGGIVTSPMMGLVGEAGPEAIIPLDKLEDIGGGGQQVVNFNITAIDTQTGIEFLLKNKPQIVGMVQQGFNSQGKTGIYR